MAESVGRTRWVSYWPPVPQLRPDHSCGVVEAQRLLRTVFTLTRPRAHPPSGFAAGRGGRRLVESQFSTLLIENLWVVRAVASGGCHKLRRSGSPPRGVAAARCACGAPFGCLIGSLYPKPRRLRAEKIPATSGRSGQPPPNGWLRHSTMLVSSRRAADPVPLGTPAD